MNRKIHLAALCLLLSAAPSPGQTGRTWSLKDCIDHALAHNIQLRRARLSAQSSATDVKEAKAGLLPTLSAAVTQSMQYRPFQEQTGNFVNGSIASSSSRKATQSGSYGINATWVVWNGGKNRADIADRTYSQQIAELAAGQEANSIQEQIAQLYVQILYSREAETTNRQLLDADRQLLLRGRELLAAGQMAKSDVAQLEAQVSSGEYDVVNSATQTAQYELQLKQLLELPGEEVLRIAGTSPDDEAVLAPIPLTAEVYQAALTSRPEIESIALGVEQSDLAVKIAKAGRMPTISLTAGLGDSHMTGTRSDYFTQMKNNFDGSLGVSLSIPIFDGRSTKSAVERAQIGQLTARLDQQDARKQLYSTIETCHQNAVSHQARYRSSVSAVKSYETSYELMSEQFRLGTANIAELLNSRSQLLSARQEMLQNKYTALLNIALLGFYGGGGIEI